MKASLSLILLFISTLTFGQSPLELEQLNPKGVALDPVNVKVFQDQSALFNTNSPFILKFSHFTDSAWRKGNYSLIRCDSCPHDQDLKTLNQRVFSKGNYFTRDGGQNWYKSPGGPYDNFAFLDSAYWVSQGANNRIYYSTNRGQSWQALNNTSYQWLNEDEDRICLYRGSDSSIFQLRPDTLEHLIHWNSQFPNIDPPGYYHQVDSTHFIFESDLKIYTYNRKIDSLWQISSLNFNRPATRLYSEGDVFIREDNLGDLAFFSDSLMNWISRTRQFNSASFGYSAGWLYYSSFIPFQTFNYGNLGTQKLIGNQKILWGSNYNGITKKIYRRDNDTSFYGIPNKIVNQEGHIIGSHGQSLEPQEQIGPIWVSRSPNFKTSIDFGSTWISHSNAGLNKPSPANLYYLIHRTLAEDSTCHLFFWQYNYDTLLLNFNNNNAFLQLPRSWYWQNYTSTYFKNCDTGAFVSLGKLYTVENQQSINQPLQAQGVSVDKIIKLGNYYYVSDKNLGLYRSPDLLNWQLYRADITFMPDVILEDSLLFKLNAERYELVYSLAPNQINSITLPAQLSHLDKANDSTLIISGFGGTVWHIKVDHQVNDASIDPFSIQKQAPFKLYPNPVQAGNSLKLELEKETPIKQITIINSIGQLVYSSRYSENIPIDPQLKAGLYFVRIESVDKGTWTEAIQVISAY